MQQSDHVRYGSCLTFNHLHKVDLWTHTGQRGLLWSAAGPRRPGIQNQPRRGGLNGPSGPAWLFRPAGTLAERSSGCRNRTPSGAHVQRLVFALQQLSECTCQIALRVKHLRIGSSSAKRLHYRRRVTTCSRAAMEFGYVKQLSYHVFAPAAADVQRSFSKLEWRRLSRKMQSATLNFALTLALSHP